MSFRFETSIIDLLLCPPAQDNFNVTRLEKLLLEYCNILHLDQIEDVVQIFYKSISELEKIGRIIGTFTCHECYTCFHCYFVISFNCFILFAARRSAVAAVAAATT